MFTRKQLWLFFMNREFFGTMAPIHEHFAAVEGFGEVRGRVALHAAET